MLSTIFSTKIRLFSRCLRIDFCTVRHKKTDLLISCNRVIVMNKPKYLPWIFAVEAVGVLSGLLSRQGTQMYAEMIQKPPLSPPGWLFPVVWTILYGLMGIGAARIAAYPAGRQRSLALNVFVIQLTVNFFWSLIFFNIQAYGLALIWIIILWLLIATMIIYYKKVDKSAAFLQIPYLLWVSFATYLTYIVWLLN